MIDLLGLNEPRGARYTLPYYRGLVYRKRRGDLLNLIDESKKLYPLFDPNAKFNNSDLFWEFSSGARIYFKFFERLDQAETFLQGQQLAHISCDELASYEDDAIFKYALSRLRSAEGLKCYFRGSCNPSKNKWVKDRFKIDNIGSATDFYEEYTIQDGSKVKKHIKFIPARLSDNKHIDTASYEAQLMLLSKADRDSLIYGRWDCWDHINGQIYENELQQLIDENRFTIVRHDKASPVFVFYDLGINDKTTLIAVQFIGKEVRCINYASDNNKSIEDHWIPLLNSWSAEHGYIYDTHYIPHDSKQRDKFDGNSIETKMRKRLGNVKVLPMHRLQDGINSTRTMFANVWIDKINCEGLLDDLQKYVRQYDNVNNCWKNDPCHNDASHSADAFRYISYYKKPVKLDMTGFDQGATNPFTY